MRSQAYTVRSKNTHRRLNEKHACRSSQNLARLGSILQVQQGFEYLIQEKKLGDLLTIDRGLTRSIALNFISTVVCFPLLPLLDVRAAFLDAFVHLLS